MKFVSTGLRVIERHDGESLTDAGSAESSCTAGVGDSETSAIKSFEFPRPGPCTLLGNLRGSYKCNEQPRR